LEIERVTNEVGVMNCYGLKQTNKTTLKNISVCKLFADSDSQKLCNINKVAYIQGIILLSNKLDNK